MKILHILFACMLLFSVGSCQIMPLIPTNEMNWSQSLPLNANITLNGGDVVGQTFATQYDTIVRQDGTNIYAIYGKNKTSIDAGLIGSTVNSRVIRSAINATPANGSLYIDRGTYSLECDLNCTTGSPSYALYYWTALPVTTDIRIFGAGMGATVLQMAPAQYSTTRPALIMYDYCPYSESGGDGVGPGHQMFSLEDLTFDGDIGNQTAPDYHDGAGLFLSGSMRYNTRIRNAEFKRSPGNVMYLGYNGGGWDNRAVVENIYTHDNYGASQIDNSEDCVIDHWVSINDGYGFWVNNRMAIVLDGMMSNSGKLFVDNMHIIDGGLYVFGYYKSREDLSLRLSNLLIDTRTIAENGITISNCNNISISDAKILAGPANYALSLTNASGVKIDNSELYGYRSVVTETGYASSVKLTGCDLNATGDCMRIYGTGSEATFFGCDFYTSSASAYWINVQAGATVSVVGCHAKGDGLVYVSPTDGVLTHSGTTGLGLEAYGATSVADGGVIAHGMKITPTYAAADGTLAGTNAIVTAKNATHLTIDLDGVTTTQTVNWVAKY